MKIIRRTDFPVAEHEACFDNAVFRIIPLRSTSKLLIPSKNNPTFPSSALFGRQGEVRAIYLDEGSCGNCIRSDAGHARILDNGDEFIGGSSFQIQSDSCA